MATTYNDIIRKRSGKAAYSLEEEKSTQWTSFIPNEQFNYVLRTVLKSVKGNDIDSHKSFWINGTYGTGKSHASAVITHLLCDPVCDIENWVDYEYGDPKFRQIKDAIYSVRKQKRLLPVKIEGLRDMSHVSDLPLVLQTAVVKALSEQNINLVVDTDFDELIAHVEQNEVIWNDLITRNISLKSIAASRDKLIQKLKSKDMGTFQRARDAQRSANMAILLGQENIGAWLIEVQNKLREISDYKGLLILWDEFTDVMEDSIGVAVLKALQTIVQKFANDENDSFFFLISHPSAFNKLGNEETKQTDGRYHRMKYNMESVSAFKIMSRKFEIIDSKGYQSIRNSFYSKNKVLLDIYTATSNDPQETRSDLQNLFPIHPATANLATHYATVVGSSSRSVFEFIGQNDAMGSFLLNENTFKNKLTVTADYLWDFVYKVFQDDMQNYAAVTERFNTYRVLVEERGAAAYAIFKGVLLLNAFNNISGDNNNDLVTPTEQNINYLFAGTQYEKDINNVLDWFNEQGVIQRAPGGVFSVQFSALPSHEIEELKLDLANDSSKFKYVSNVLKFGDTAASFIERKFIQKNIRPYKFDFYSIVANDSILKESIKRNKRTSRTSDLYLALLFAKNNEEIAHLRQVAKEISEAASNVDKELRDVVLIVFDNPFGDKEYARFIEYMANCSAAQAHGFLDQVNVHNDHAKEMIKEWLQNTQRGNAEIYVNEKYIPISVKHLSSTLNNIVAPAIFPLGPDAVELLRTKAANTFWKPQVSKEIIRTFIFAKTKDEALNVAGQMKPVQYLIQDALDDNMKWRDDIPERQPFKAVFDFIQNKIKSADKSQLFNLVEKFDDLRRPPYGLSGNYASAAMVAFAMRNYAGKIFDILGKPINQNNLTDAIAELFGVWEKGKSTNKLSFKFQTPEEVKLCEELVTHFKLKDIKGYNDISSLKDARYAITSAMLEEAGYPLWALKYMDKQFRDSPPAIRINNDILCRLIDNIVSICADKEMKNPALVNDTLDLIIKCRYDISDVLAKSGNFRNGFINFLKSQPKIALQQDEVERAYDYIKKNLQSTVGYWSEDEVKQCLKDWRIAERNAVEEERKREEEAREKVKDEEIKRLEEQAQVARDEAIKELKGDVDKLSRKKEAARLLIDKADRMTLYSILDQVIDLDFEFIVDKIIKSYHDIKYPRLIEDLSYLDHERPLFLNEEDLE